MRERTSNNDSWMKTLRRKNGLRRGRRRRRRKKRRKRRRLDWEGEKDEKSCENLSDEN